MLFRTRNSILDNKNFPADLDFSAGEMLDMVTPKRPSTSLVPRIGGKGNGRMPPADPTSTITRPPDAVYGEPRKRQDWTSNEGLDLVRCRRILEHIFILAYYVAITGYTPKSPLGLSLGNGCCVTNFFTSLPKELQTGRLMPRAPENVINFQHES